MTPQQHVAYAEQLLDTLRSDGAFVDPADVLALALDAIGHAIIALAVEVGVPHDTAPEAGDGSEG